MVHIYKTKENTNNIPTTRKQYDDVKQKGLKNPNFLRNRASLGTLISYIGKGQKIVLV